jgi:hypothetical protein
MAERLARELAEELPALLSERVSGDVSWAVPVLADSLATDVASGGIAMIDAARERLLREGWDFAVVLTDVPLRIGRRPVVADVSATHGVALLSLPALGVVQLRRRARDAVTRMVDGLLGESLELDGCGGAGRRLRVGRRLSRIAAPVRPVVPEDEGVDLRFVAAVLRGHLRLILGMVRANRPWRLISRLSRALFGALVAVVFALVTSDIWRAADGTGWIRLTAFSVASIAATVIALIAAHDLWERTARGHAREQVVLFNVATALTVTLGVLWLYGTLFVLALAGAGLALEPRVLADGIGHQVAFGDYVRLAWLIASLATVGGALGSGLESDAAVREAAYGYRTERRTERDAASGS